MGRYLAEVKNSAKVYFSSQIRDTLEMALAKNRIYVVLVRASTFQKMAASPFDNIVKRAGRTPGLAVVGCLPG